MAKQCNRLIGEPGGTRYVSGVACFCAMVATTGPAVREARAHVVLFAPETVYVAPGEPKAAFDLTIVADWQFDGADLVIGSDLAIADFAFAPEFLAAMSGLADTLTNVGIYEHDIFVTGNGPNLVGPTLPLGTLWLDTSSAAPGSYEVWIDSYRDGNWSSMGGEAPYRIIGHGLIVVPEPGTLSLVALGLAGLARRRRPMSTT